jgi:hypothetical protein
VAGVLVQATPESPGRGGGSDRTRSATTEADGRFRIDGLGRETVGISVQPRRSRGGDAPWPYLPFYQAGVAAGTRDLVIRLEEGVRIEGEVFGPDGSPVRDASVWVAPVQPTGDRPAPRQSGGGGSANAQLSGGSNRFSIGPLAPGRYVVTANGQGRLGKSEPVEVTAPTTGVRLVLARAFLLEGRVLGADVQNFNVQFLRFDAQNRSSNGSGVSGDGRFSFQRENDDEGVLFVCRMGDDRMAWVERVRPSAGPYDIRLEDGLRIEGRIDGLPSPFPTDGRRPQVAARDDSRSVTVHGAIQPDGTFSIRGLPRGTYSLQAWGGNPRANARVEGIAAGARNVTLRLTTER